MSRFFQVALLVLLGVGCSKAQPTFKIRVDAGPLDRIWSPVSLPLPPETTWDTARLIGDDGVELAIQRRGDVGWFILPELVANNSLELTLVPDASATPALGMEQSPEAVSFKSNGTEVVRYWAQPRPPPRADIPQTYARGGYLHPVNTPSGITVTDDYPDNHIHHHGIWGAWTNTRFEGRTPDFWNMGNETGTVVPLGLEDAWSGPVAGGLTGQHQYLDLMTASARPALNETWNLTVFHIPNADYHLFDLHVIQTTATDSTLFLPEYRYGGVGFRGHGDWNGPENTHFLTSEGKDRSNGHATHARWCHIGGLVNEAFAGIGILGHPENFRAPQPMRIHPTEPFFNWAPSQAGDWEIAPKTTYEARYRFVVRDGVADPALLERLWQDYAEPPEVTWIE